MLLAGGVSVFPIDISNMTSIEMYEVALGLPQARCVPRGYAVTANLFVPAKIFQEYGKFDQSRFSGGDVEFCRRIVSHNVPLDYCESARVDHPARRNWHELEAKVRRVKGGQITAGSLSSRILYTIRTLLPPLRDWYYALNSTKLPLNNRLQVCWIQGRLWFVELSELYCLFRGKTPNRS
jgi:GT2 family glycosyltransferase